MSRAAATAAILLALATLVLLAAGPIGLRGGLWRYPTSLMLFRWSGYVALAGAALALLALVFRQPLSPRLRWGAVAAFVACALFFSMPFYYRLAGGVSIHDISTDTDNPPAFEATLAARAAEHGAGTAYDRARIVPIQKKAYPDIAPLHLDLAPAEAFKRALATAQGMTRWTVVASDPARGRIEASARSFWMGFTDDIVIRITPEGEGSRVDMRSMSRQGRGDFGVNAARIRAYFAALRANPG